MILQTLLHSSLFYGSKGAFCNLEAKIGLVPSLVPSLLPSLVPSNVPSLVPNFVPSLVTSLVPRILKFDLWHFFAQK